MSILDDLMGEYGFSVPKRAYDKLQEHIAARQTVGQEPPGMVLVQIADAERLCRIGESFGQAFDQLPVMRVRALIDASKAVQS